MGDADVVKTMGLGMYTRKHREIGAATKSSQKFLGEEETGGQGLGKNCIDRMSHRVPKL